jgi:hypothetical protein
VKHLQRGETVTAGGLRITNDSSKSVYWDVTKKGFASYSGSVAAFSSSIKQEGNTMNFKDEDQQKHPVEMLDTDKPAPEIMELRGLYNLMRGLAVRSQELTNALTRIDNSGEPMRYAHDTLAQERTEIDGRLNALLNRRVRFVD